MYGVDVKLVAVTSPTAERRDAFAKETGVTAYPTVAAMLPHVDVVDVCSPPATHEPVEWRRSRPASMSSSRTVTPRVATGDKDALYTKPSAARNGS